MLKYLSVSHLCLFLSSIAITQQILSPLCPITQLKDVFYGTGQYKATHPVPMLSAGPAAGINSLVLPLPHGRLWFGTNRE